MTGQVPEVRAPEPMGRGTLGRKLVFRVVALVALVAILLAAATTLATRTVLLQQADQQLDAASARQQMGGPPGRGLLRPGQPIGTLIALLDTEGRLVDSGVLGERGRNSSVPPAAVAQLQRLEPNQEKHSVYLPGLGHYRVAAYQARLIDENDQPVGNGVVVIGVSLKEVDDALSQLLGLEVVLFLITIAAAILIARSLVARSLRPLYRVADAARQVSALALDKGAVSLGVRVRPEDANPTNEVGQVGQALNHLLDNVEEALEARQASETKLRQFVADASHELRNPLAAIRGYAELTRRSGEQVPPDAAYAISRVESEAGRMSHLVEDLLLLARLDAGPALDIRPTDLSELLINAVSDARAAGPDHFWALRLPEHPVIAMADTHRLYQVVANLLANARTHTPPGTRVDSALALDHDTAVITVTDNGPGIAPELRDKVFERFTRADTSRVRVSDPSKGGSTGLGLAIVAAVVEAHAGTVTVESAPGWTKFIVRLPTAQPARPTSAPVPVAG